MCIKEKRKLTIPPDMAYGAYYHTYNLQNSCELPLDTQARVDSEVSSPQNRLLFLMSSLLPWIPQQIMKSFKCSAPIFRTLAVDSVHNIRLL
jgi:hypothetical protein